MGIITIYYLVVFNILSTINNLTIIIIIIIVIIIYIYIYIYFNFYNNFKILMFYYNFSTFAIIISIFLNVFMLLKSFNLHGIRTQEIPSLFVSSKFFSYT